MKCTDGIASISLALRELQASLTHTDEKFFSRIVCVEVRGKFLRASKRKLFVPFTHY